MNSIRQVQALNKRELEAVVSPEASWHADYRDTAYIYIGGLPFDLSEGDIITIFSQFGEPVFINLVRDKETGKSKGFAFLKYEDQRSCDLAVDNLGGATVMGRILRVDHTRYKKKDDEDLGDNTLGGTTNGNEEDSRKKRKSDDVESESEEERRPVLKEERELAELMRNHDDDDPMKAYLIEQKKEEVQLALQAIKKRDHRRKDDKHGSTIVVGDVRTLAAHRMTGNGRGLATEGTVRGRGLETDKGVAHVQRALAGHVGDEP
ncbi:RNA-binding protein Cwf29 [Coniosporium apollinis]|uniref:RNA-binding protein Cwf29 n=1 Tax=Coniosporium apollinis TaxID=61459 RepID=A0ABQ9NGR6_9PEZI|nr:RNA-binding protein Cwf29 [Coniosporium apollinis]